MDFIDDDKNSLDNYFKIKAKKKRTFFRAPEPDISQYPGCYLDTMKIGVSAILRGLMLYNVVFDDSTVNT